MVKERAVITSKEPEEIKKKIIITEVKENKKFNVPVFSIKQSKVNIEYPKLGRLYKELQDLIIEEAASRSRELQLIKSIEVDNKRKEIREFEKEFGITREHHLRWAGIY